MKPIEIIPLFDEFLHNRSEELRAVIIGAGALSLLGIVSRETRDIDVIDPEIPTKILDLAREFSKQNKQIRDTWLNNGPLSMRERLPHGWQNRLQEIYKGKALTIFTLSRIDLLATKLQGLGDRGSEGPDVDDIRAMRPTMMELEEAFKWAKEQDANPEWPNHLIRLIDSVMRK